MTTATSLPRPPPPTRPLGRRFRSTSKKAPPTVPRSSSARRRSFRGIKIFWLALAGNLWCLIVLGRTYLRAGTELRDDAPGRVLRDIDRGRKAAEDAGARRKAAAEVAKEEDGGREDDDRGGDRDDYSHLQPRSDVDPAAIERATRRALDPAAGGRDRCDNVLLYLPGQLGHAGLGSQLNTYLLAAAVATFTDRALVILDPPNDERFDGNSAFGCPKGSIVREEGNVTTVWGDYERGFRRLVDHPAWLSRGCDVPCRDTHEYEDWEAEFESYRKKYGRFDWNGKTFGGYKVERDRRVCDDAANETSIPLLGLTKKLKKCKVSKVTEPRERTPVTCGANDASVLVLGANPLRNYFVHMLKERMAGHDQTEAESARWALNFGASIKETRAFASLRDERRIWDAVSAWMTRTGLPKFQPWIAADVRDLARAKLGFIAEGRPYDSVHVRRGDKCYREAKDLIREYYEQRGMNWTLGMSIPFSHYLRRFDDGTGEDCDAEGDGPPPRRVYVATTGQRAVRAEAARLAPSRVGRCRRPLEFHYYPDAAKAYHIQYAERCRERYDVNLVSVAELATLTRSEVFVGEFNSNWGRLVRTLRTTTDRRSSELGGATTTREVRVAWGPEEPEPPGY
ncbi:hypothetical protein ACHAWF_003131 [Thalassiosira exigua]